MTWIMVEKHKLADVRVECEQDNTAERTVTPSDMLLIFFVSVLRVQDGHVAIAEKIYHFTPFSRCKIPCLSPVNPIPSSELHLKRFVRFIVRHVGDRSGAGKEPIPSADTRVISEFCLHLNFANVKLHFFQLFDHEMTRQFP